MDYVFDKICMYISLFFLHKHFPPLQDSLRICLLPTILSYDAPWPVRKVPLRCTPHFIVHHLETKTYCVVTSNSEPTLKIWKFNGDDKVREGSLRWWILRPVMWWLFTELFVFLCAFCFMFVWLCYLLQDMYYIYMYESFLDISCIAVSEWYCTLISNNYISFSSMTELVKSDYE